MNDTNNNGSDGRLLGAFSCRPNPNSGAFRLLQEMGEKEKAGYKPPNNLFLEMWRSLTAAFIDIGEALYESFTSHRR